MSKLAIAYAMKKKSKKMAEGGEVHPKETYDEKKKRVEKEASSSESSTIKGLRSMSTGFADGGFVSKEKKSGFMEHEGNDVKHNSAAMNEDGKDLNQHKVDMHESTSMSKQDLVDRIMDRENKEYDQLARLAHGGEVAGSLSNESYDNCEEDMVDRIMMKRHGDKDDFSDLDRYSEGGKVANQDHGPMDSRLSGFDQNEFDDLSLRDDLESSYGDDDNSGDALGNEQEDEDRKDIVARIMKSRAKKDKNPRPA